MNCLVLAGGIPPPGDSLHFHAGGQPKVLIDIDGRPILWRVLDALAGADRIERIVVAGLPASVQPGEGTVGDFDPDAGGAIADYVADACGPVADYVADAGGPVANLFAGVDRLVEIGSRHQPFVFCWGDLPLVTTELVNAFLTAIADAPYEITVGLVGRARVETLRPGIETRYLRLREGDFKSTDFGTAVPDAVYRVRGYFEALAPQRKNIFQLARLISPTLLMRYASGRLGYEELGRRISRKVGTKCGVVVVDQAEMCLDIDDDVDLAWCREHVRAAASARH